MLPANSMDAKYASMMNAIASDAGLYSELMAFLSDLQASHRDMLHELAEKALYDKDTAPYALRQAGAVNVLGEIMDMLSRTKKQQEQKL